MPRLIDPIDRIAQRLQREVLMLTFCGKSPHEGGSFDDEGKPDDRETDLVRAVIVAWRDSHGIPYKPCFGLWCEGLIVSPYRGFLLLDVPYDATRPDYRALAEFIEDENAVCRHAGVGFHIVPHDRHLVDPAIRS